MYLYLVKFTLVIIIIVIILVIIKIFYLRPVNEYFSSNDTINGYPFFDLDFYIKNIYNGLIVPYNSTQTLVTSENIITETEIKVNNYLNSTVNLVMDSGGWKPEEPFVKQESNFFVLQETINDTSQNDNSKFIIQLYLNHINVTKDYFFYVTDYGKLKIVNGCYNISFFIYEKNYNYSKAINIEFIINKTNIVVNKISIPNTLESYKNFNAINENDTFFKIKNKYGLTYPFSDDTDIMYISPENYKKQLKEIEKKYGLVNTKQP
jgi:hypothetical protein